MPPGEELKIGKIAVNTDSYGMGMEGAGIGSSPITMPNTDYNSFRPNNVNNNVGFLGLTAQHTTVKIDSKYLDMAFNDGGNNVGLNPFFRPPETATKIFTA